MKEDQSNIIISNEKKCWNKSLLEDNGLRKGLERIDYQRTYKTSDNKFEILIYGLERSMLAEVGRYIIYSVNDKSYFEPNFENYFPELNIKYDNQHKTLRANIIIKEFYNSNQIDSHDIEIKITCQNKKYQITANHIELHNEEAIIEQIKSQINQSKLIKLKSFLESKNINLTFVGDPYDKGLNWNYYNCLFDEKKYEMILNFQTTL